MVFKYMRVFYVEDDDFLFVIFFENRIKENGFILSELDLK